MAVAAVIQESNKIIFAYTGFHDTDASTSPVFPLVNADDATYITGIRIQNAGAAAARTSRQLHRPGQRRSLHRNADDCAPMWLRHLRPGRLQCHGPSPGTDCAKGAKFIGSAQVTANSTSRSSASATSSSPT